MLGLTAYLAMADAAAARPPAPQVAIVGATLIDVSHAGRGEADIADSVVVISQGRIVAAGDRAHVRLPAHARIIQAKGRFLIPGLIDGWGAMRSQGFADAYLYEGVTTVIVPTAPANAAVDGEVRIFPARDGPSIVTSAPISGYAADGDVPNVSPWLDHRRKDVRLTPEALKTRIAAAAAHGDHILAVGQDVWPDQLDLIVTEAHRLGLAVTAQPAFASYPFAISAGVDAFTRNDRYSMALSRPQDFIAYADNPFGGGGRPAIRTICRSEALTAQIATFADQLATAHVALMPVLSMEATADDVGAPNPWTLRAARFVSPGELDDPVDPQTGARPYLVKQPAQRERLQACARSKQAIDRGLHAQGATYLAGTATPSYGVIPGGGLHGELRLLQSIGLTPREVLAAATSNIADALRMPDRGQIEAGRRADLVLLASDPRLDSAAAEDISLVMIEGRTVNRGRLLAGASGRGAERG